MTTKTYKIDLLITPKEVLDVAALQEELSVALGVPLQDIGVSSNGAGEEVFTASRQGKTEVSRRPLNPHVTITVPEGASANKVHEAFNAHAPEKTPTERLEEKARMVEDERIRNSPVVKDLLNRLAALEGRGK